MPGEPENDGEDWYRPVWEIEDETALEPPGSPRARKSPSGATARSRLPQAVDAVLRAHMTAAGMVREATGKASWRAYALS
jgi:hypothetical protein